MGMEAGHGAGSAAAPGGVGAGVEGSTRGSCTGAVSGAWATTGSGSGAALLRTGSLFSLVTISAAGGAFGLSGSAPISVDACASGFFSTKGAGGGATGLTAMTLPRSAGRAADVEDPSVALRALSAEFCAMTTDGTHRPTARAITILRRAWVLSVFTSGFPLCSAIPGSRSSRQGCAAFRFRSCPGW